MPGGLAETARRTALPRHACVITHPSHPARPSNTCLASQSPRAYRSCTSEVPSAGCAPTSHRAQRHHTVEIRSEEFAPSQDCRRIPPRPSCTTRIQIVWRTSRGMRGIHSHIPLTTTTEAYGRHNAQRLRGQCQACWTPALSNYRACCRALAICPKASFILRT